MNRYIGITGCACHDLDGVLEDAGVTTAPVRAELSPTIAVTVFGTPGPQGSKKAVGSRVGKNGQRYTALIESSKKVKPWREAVADAATAALDRLSPAERAVFPLGGPLRAEMVFTLKPPARIPAVRYVGGVPYPSAYPDSSKLVRSTEDALTGVLWRDDAQVVLYTLVAKYYPGYGCPGALDAPGAFIRISPLGGVS